MGKNMILTALIILLLSGCGGFWTDQEKTADQASQGKALETVYGLIEAMDQENWSAYAGLLAAANREDFTLFTANPANRAGNIGLYNIRSARLLEIKTLPGDILSRLTRLSAYNSGDRELAAFYAGIDCTVNSDNSDYVNGVNYMLFILVKEEGAWKVTEMSAAPLEILTSAGCGFGSLAETEALDRFHARAGGGSRANADHVVPVSIRVRLSSGVITTVDFITYVKNVLPNEWYASWLPESLKAGALAVKMYGWYRVYYPKYPGYGYDVKDTTADQVYVAGSAVSSTSAAVDAVNGVGLENSDGYVFEAQYLAGTAGVPGTASSGKMMQWGTQYFASAGTGNCIDMCHYYYDYSDKSAGAIRVFSYGSSATSDGNVYQWNGSGWNQITGSANRMSVDNAGNVWVVNREGMLWRWNGSWTKMRTGDTQDVGCGANGTVVVTTADINTYGGRILRWDGGNGWPEVGGTARRVDVDSAGNIWVVNGAGDLYYFNGAWTCISAGNVQDVGCGPNGQVAFTMINDNVNGGKIINWNGSGWIEIDGRAVTIDVAADGSLWVINAGGMVWQYISGGWSQRKDAGGMDVGCSPLRSTVWLLSH